MENRDYDVVIIGTGMGALTTASLLAQFTDKKVLMLEQHFKAGGFTHTFKREGKFLWDVGIHYVGDMHPESSLRKIFDIVTGGKVQWNPMPEVFEKFVFPDFTFSVRKKEENYKSDLIALFPEESSSIEGYFEDVKKIASWQGRHMLLKGLPPFLDSNTKSINLAGSESLQITTKEYLDKNFQSEKLKAILASQWGDYGLPPSLSSFLIHAMVVAHYLNGGYYPEGGSGVIADSVKKILESKGGKILISREVQEILVENGTAVGVRVKNKIQSNKTGKDVLETYFCKKVISNAGAYNTYTRLLPKSLNLSFQDSLQNFNSNYPKISNVTLYIGLKEDPRNKGFYGENHWIYANLDHEKNFSGMDWTETGKLPGAYLSFPSLKDSHPEGHTAEVIAFCEYDYFTKCKDQTWKERDEDYQKKKVQITQMLLKFIEERYPGFISMIEFAELATPVTTEYFTNHHKGTIYGMPCVPERFLESKSPWFNTLTPIKNLFLTGADASSPGVSGAMMGGVIAFTNSSDGVSMLKVIKEVSTKKTNEAKE